MPRTCAPAVERALAKVSYEHGCWVFHGSRLPAGYGKIGSDGGRAGRMVLVHRLMYETFVGPIPDGHDIDHLCRNTSCCNPIHLEAVTRQTNVERGIGWRNGVEAAALSAKSETHCSHGHEFTVENTYLYTTKSGERKRFCRACRAAYNSAGWARKKENLQ